jgi:hypothetical protein
MHWSLRGGGGGGGGTVTPETIPLDDLSDVDTTGASEGKILKYDNSSGVWIIGDDTGSGGPLSGLSDVDTTGVSTDDLLAYDGANWVDVDPAVLGPKINLVGVDAGKPAASSANNALTYFSTDVNGGTMPGCR